MKIASVWLRRYGWAERAALVLAMGCALLVDTFTSNVLLLTASAYGGGTGYYGALLGAQHTSKNKIGVSACWNAL